MDVTEVRIKLSHAGPLKAFCSITFDDEFVVRDLKVIEGQRGLFVAMPSRKTMAKCPACASKNELRARYCSGCGSPLPTNLGSQNRLFSDIAHPINAAFRGKIQEAVLSALEQERIRAQESGYVCTYDDGYEAA